MKIRQQAILMLHRILNQGQKADVLINRTDFDGRDKALLHEIIYGVLRRYYSLEADFCRFVQDKPDELMRMALFVGFYQLRYMRVPTHAAVYETVEAIKKLQPNTTSRVNAILRRCVRTAPPKKLKPWQQCELPQDVYKTWRDAFGLETVKAFSVFLQTPPPLTVAVLIGSREDWIAACQQQDIEAKVGSHSPWAVILPLGTFVADLPGYDDGQFMVMDQAAQMSVGVLNKASKRHLDLCSAPGGKMIVASKQLSDAHIVGVERTESRLPRLQENMLRMQSTAKLVHADALQLPFADQSFDSVLLDAPCSASGIIRRHPDAKFLHSLNDAAQLAKRQFRMLEEAIRVCRPGGQIVYAVCSLHPQETEAVVKQVQDRCDPLALPSDLQALQVSEGMVRLFPNEEHDGFFIANLTRK
ncbi:MAG: transcription antitermination factor NusB [Mariprofundaceae bacterium]|nr:transcription antitermination factor NusB [Mariprofundaceae bacterium]